jgi:POT family proton-dependent oligopeptide transporter
MSQNTTDEFFKTLFLDILQDCSYCFTEMWERFSYYGMRALLVLFLTSSLAKGAGHGVLKMPWLCMELILCGFISLRNWGFLADRYLGYRWAVVLGALAMTLGHASMAVETPLFLYIELGFLL